MNASTSHETPWSELDQLRADLLDEQRALDDAVTSISDRQWRLATASPGWSVADQIGHLTYFDAAATEAIVSPENFRRDAAELFRSAGTIGVDDFTLREFRALDHADQLDSWRHHRDALGDAAASLVDSTRVAWYGPSMGAKSFLSARLMEVWAHGTDVVDAIGATRPASDRLRHVAQLGFNTRNWSYAVRADEVPPGEVALELVGPSGQLWRWGTSEAHDTVRGLAEEFCLVVTQRRHLDDTSLVTGDLGRHWLVRAQAFAGAPSTGPQPRSARATDRD